MPRLVELAKLYRRPALTARRNPTIRNLKPGKGFFVIPYLRLGGFHQRGRDRALKRILERNFFSPTVPNLASKRDKPECTDPE
jgi:hypothetical protein